MDEILHKANELGLMIKGSDLFRRYEELARKVDADPEAKSLLQEYAAISEALYEKESKGAPIEVEDKKKLQESAEKVSKNQLIKEYIATHSYFMNFMMQVQKIISEPEGEAIEPSRIIKPNTGAGGKIITGI